MKFGINIELEKKDTEEIYNQLLEVLSMAKASLSDNFIENNFVIFEVYNATEVLKSMVYDLHLDYNYMTYFKD